MTNEMAKQMLGDLADEVKLPEPSKPKEKSGIVLKTMIQSSSQRPRHLAQLMESLHPSNRTVSVVEDRSGTSWGGLKKVLEVATKSKAATHILVLQEDVLACANLLLAVEKICTLYPQMLISLFNPRQAIESTRYNANRLIEADSFWYAQAYVLPIEMAKEILEFESASDRDDQRVNEYLKSKGLKYLVTAPSLVEHMDWRHTTIPAEKDKTYHRTKMIKSERQAVDFIGLEQSALDIDWR